MINNEEIVEFVQELVTALTGSSLSPLQQLILSESLAEFPKTYAQIAQENNYSENYVKQGVAFKLWQQLSEIFGEKVNKTNCRCLLEARLPKLRLTANFQSIPPLATINLESPEGQVPLTSPFYIERQVQSIACREILSPGTLLRIKAPRQRGKTSLMVRILAYARKSNYYTARLSLNRAGTNVFVSLEKFLRWFCVNVTRQLGIESQLDDYWDEDLGALLSCTIYFQEYLLKKISRPFVLALDEVNQLFDYPSLSHDFFSLLRSWHEETRDVSVWQQLRLLIIHSTDIYLPFKTNKSPFNVGLPLELPPFDRAEMENLAQRHGLQLEVTELEQLLKLTGGFPYLVRLAFYHTVRHQLPLATLRHNAATETGIFRDHLHEQLWHLQQYPKLMAAFKQLLATRSALLLDIETSFKLASLGLVNLEGNQVSVSCGLYQQYFERVFSPLEINNS